MSRISVIPFYKTGLKNRIFNDKEVFNYPFILKNFLQDHGYAVDTVDITSIKDANYVIFFDLDMKYILQALMLGKLDRCIYIPFEPPVVMTQHEPENLKKISKLFSKVLTWQDDLIDNEKFLKFFFPIPEFKSIIEFSSFTEKKLLTTVVGYKHSNHPDELYSKRIEAIKFFEKNHPDSFDLYGMGWNKSEFISYKGPVDDKLTTMSHYKFALCYENQCNINGLISEKIFDCFYAKTIPIFWGAENVLEYIPEACFIDKRNFASYEELFDYINSMTCEEYNERVNAINDFLSSNEFSYYTASNFTDRVYKSLVQIDSNNSAKFGKACSLVWLVLRKLKIRMTQS